ncbi:MAG TPA: response regulator [Phycisphaerae bacterium]|nr:response regulator [Phycisphaerae bacterium]
MAEVGVVHVVDDDPSIRDLIQVALQRAQLRVKTYPSAEAFAALDLDTEFSGALPSCVLLDLIMPGISGLELLEAKGKGNPCCPVIVMTARGTVESAVKAMKLGAVDFIEKPFSSEALTALVLEALKKHQASKSICQDREAVRRRLSILSPREAELLEAIVLGRSTKMIADTLGISARTVDHHRANLMDKMQATNVADLVRMAVEADYKTVNRVEVPTAPPVQG